jgi:hypothetical protein
MLDKMQAYAKRELTRAYSQFGKDPSAQNWTLLKRAMLVYQQAVRVMRTSKPIRDELVYRLEVTPTEMWADCIVNATTGKRMSELLEYC